MVISTTGLIGYCQPLTIHAGETTELKLSSNGPDTCSVAVMRVVCGDIDPNGPGASFETAEWCKATGLPVRPQPANAGSFGFAPRGPATGVANSLRLEMNVWPTLPAGKPQCLLHWGDLRLEMDRFGHLGGRLGNSAAILARPLPGRRWFRIILEASDERIAVSAEPIETMATWPHVERSDAPAPFVSLPGCDNPIIFGAAMEGWRAGHPVVTCAYNGKIEAPVIKAGAVATPIAAWDFSRHIESAMAHDTGPQGVHLTLVNTPMRGATGSNWNGSVESWRRDPSQYGAIHFHDDDMTDCRWDTSLRITAPDASRSGYYIARVTSDDVQSDVPFFLSVQPGQRQADILLIAATATYLSYANTHIKFDSQNTENLYEAPMVLSEDELYLNEHRELGLSHYDTHADDSGVVYSSERRPLMNMRPGLYTFNYVNDTHIVQWLESRGFGYDLATDEDLHRHGRDLLDGYRVVITGSHPEYYSTRMWDALHGYQQSGGRHLYLGGNGFYWRVAWSDAHPGIVENRRGISGVRTWEGEPGEHHLSFSGEPGGLWRTHGRAPQMLVGTGFSSTCFVRSTYFRRTEASRDPALAFVFDGLNSDVIGDFGYRGGGAVGLELDRWDADLGSPPGSVILATSEDVGQGGLLTGEEFITTTRALDGLQNRRVRADMVYFTTAGGGAVWSAGSIAWATSLLWNAGSNPVSRVTENVLRRFLDPEPLPGPPSAGDR